MNGSPCDAPWVAIRKPVFFEQPEVQQDLLPVWSFSALYDQPDGEVPRPASYLADDGVVAWCIRTYAHKEPDEDTRAATARRFWYYGARHLDTRFRLVHRPAGRGIPRPVSETYADAEKDWDFVMQFRDRILQREGLTPSSPPREIAHAFAHELYKNWRGGGSISHPADVLTHRAYCLGAATATTAILESLGIPARGAAVSDHAVCEAFVDGAWRLIDSSNHFIDHEPRSDCMLPSDYVLLTTQPDLAAHGDRISDYHRGFFYHFPQAHYRIPDGRWVGQSMVEMCPAYARALYPEHAALRFKTRDPGRLVVLERSIRMLYRYDLGVNLHPGDRLRESVYLGTTDDVREFEFELRFAHIDGLFPGEAAVRDLVLHVGGERLCVGAAATWPMKPHWDRTALLPIRLPRSLFRPHSVNWLQVENVSRGRIFRFPVGLAVVEPYIAPLSRGSSPRGGPQT